jgi:hypothetical protein
MAEPYKSPLVRALEEVDTSNQSSADHQLALMRLKEHMYDISDDPRGSDPYAYMSFEDARTCEEFTDLANSRGWPNTSPLEMRIPRLPGIPLIGHAWTNARNTEQSLLTKKLFFTTSASEKGYAFGKLGIEPPQLVALCSDGLLRSLRGSNYELSRSKAYGWGRLPHPDILVGARAVGAANGVEYSNSSLQNLGQILVAKMGNADH